MPTCLHCNYENSYEVSHCDDCGNLISYPNYRFAKQEQAKLHQRYTEAESNASRRNIASQLSILKDLARQSKPVTSMSYTVAANLLRDQKHGRYHNYYQLLEKKMGSPSAPADHAARTTADSWIYPIFGKHLLHAALSCDGTGLPSYGEVAVSWKTDSVNFEQRLAILEDNSFEFWKRYHTHLGCKLPHGYRAIWADRIVLAVSKLAHSLAPSDSKQDIIAKFKLSAPERANDQFMEVTVFHEAGLSSQHVAEVYIEVPPHTVPMEDQENLQITVDALKQDCVRHKIGLKE